MKLSNRAQAIQPSATLAITAAAKAMAAQGEDVLSFSAGEPDFGPPEPVRKAAVRAVEENRSKYAPTAGIPALREAIAAKLAADNGLTYDPAAIAVTVGAKQALFNGLQALLNPGDEALIPAPYWVSYPEQVKAAGGIPVFVPSDGDFIPRPEALTEALTERTRVLFLNSPNNPTGAVYPKAVLEAIAAALADRPDVTVISDEIYEKLLYDGATHHSIASFPGMAERTLLVNGFSKTYAVPGWRIGYAAGPEALIKAMCRLQGHATSNAPSLVQHAMLAAFDVDRAWFEEKRAEFDSRRKIICDGLNGIGGLSVKSPPGTFYAFTNIADLLPGTIDGHPVATSTDFATHLLKGAKTAVIPGTPFGAEGHIRLSFAAPAEDIRRGIERIADFVGQMKIG